MYESNVDAVGIIVGVAIAVVIILLIIIIICRLYKHQQSHNGHNTTQPAADVLLQPIPTGEFL